MAAKINNFPLYVVYDRSFDGVPTSVLTDSATDLTLGTVGLSRDSNLTTSYLTRASRANIVTGGITTTWDYGKVFFTPILYFNVDFTTGGTGNYQHILDYSYDNITWTNIFGGAHAAGTENKTVSMVLNPVRYIRVQYYTGAGTAGFLTVEYKELRLMGSG